MYWYYVRFMNINVAAPVFEETLFGRKFKA